MAFVRYLFLKKKMLMVKTLDSETQLESSTVVKPAWNEDMNHNLKISKIRESV